MSEHDIIKLVQPMQGYRKTALRFLERNEKLRIKIDQKSLYILTLSSHWGPDRNPYLLHNLINNL
jgi:hypothetical protein